MAGETREGQDQAKELEDHSRGADRAGSALILLGGQGKKRGHWCGDSDV